MSVGVTASEYFFLKSLTAGLSFFVSNDMGINARIFGGQELSKETVIIGNLHFRL